MSEAKKLEDKRQQEAQMQNIQAAAKVSTVAQAVEEAESVMKFPMLFPIKVMGLASESFKTTVEDIAKAHFDDFKGDATTVEYSRTRKYMSVTVTVNARSRAQLDEAYRAFTSNPLVKIVL